MQGWNSSEMRQVTECINSDAFAALCSKMKTHFCFVFFVLRNSDHSYEKNVFRRPSVTSDLTSEFQRFENNNSQQDIKL